MITRGFALYRTRYFQGVQWQRCQFHFPSSHRKGMRATNSLERFNEEIRERRVVLNNSLILQETYRKF